MICKKTELAARTQNTRGANERKSMELNMRYAAALPLVAASLIGSASIPERANAQTNPYALDRLFLAQSQKQSFDEVLDFTNETEVANYYGVGTEQARLATDFFKGYTGSSANMLFIRLPVLSARAHLVGSDVSALTLTQLQAINGPLSLTSQGYNYSATINLSGVTGSGATAFKNAAVVIQTALNQNLPVAAVTTGSSIKPVSVAFTGSISGLLMTVTAAPAGSIQVGSMISGRGIPAGAQITSQVSGTTGGAGVYGLYVPEGHISTETLTETYGVLTVGSGTVKAGQQVTGNGVLPLTAIEGQLSGNTWLVNFAQTVASQQLTMTGAPLQVEYTAVTGQTKNSGYFSIQQNGDFLYNSSSIGYATSTTAATTLGLTQGLARVSSPGEIVPISTLSAWMNNFIATQTNQFYTFQTTWDPADATPPGEQAALEAWATSEGGLFKYLSGYSANTPPIKNMLTGSAALPFAATAVPEPSTWLMALLGFAGLGLVSRYRARGWTCPSGWRIGSTGRASGDSLVVR